ncbi:MAG: hypothetical protein QXR43_08495 [Thermofilum sp.]
MYLICAKLEEDVVALVRPHGADISIGSFRGAHVALPQRSAWRVYAVGGAVVVRHADDDVVLLARCGIYVL